MFTIDSRLKSTQIELAAVMCNKFVTEKAFWDFLAIEFYGSGVTDDLIQHETFIRKHFEFMFNDLVLTIFIRPYTSKNPFSSVLGHAKGNTIFENTRKLNALTLPERIGHIGHEVTHLFGYSHSGQRDKYSATVLFGNCLEKYAEIRLNELGIKF